MSERVRVRYAPSPTGFQHIGGLRTALFNYLYAKANGGDFILRIEDTDRTRFFEGALEDIFETFRWVGIDYDEGPVKGGEYAPYLQSERRNIYEKYALELVEKDLAYFCFCSSERLEKMKKEQEKNQQYEKARNDLVSGISHDLRTPLTSIKGYIKGLQDGVAFTPEKQERYLSIAYKKACDMEVLLHRLSYFSKMESGKLPLVLKNMDLRDFVKRYVSEIGDELKHRNISVIIECSEESHMVLIDEEQMTRVITNLVENAIHYANTDCLALKMQVWKEGDLEHFVFSDNGQGVTDEQLSHLFEQFWRGDESRSSRNGSGSGLGLYIVKYIIEAHGGTVQAENAKGLMIKMEIPVSKEGLHEQYIDC
jgi:signal transduction histidine kinase